MDEATAIVRLADPAITPQELADIAYHVPSLRAKVAAHPSAYPELLEWLKQFPDPDVQAAVSARMYTPAPGPAPTMTPATPQPAVSNPSRSTSGIIGALFRASKLVATQRPNAAIDTIVGAATQSSTPWVVPLLGGAIGGAIVGFFTAVQIAAMMSSPYFSLSFGTYFLQFVMITFSGAVGASLRAGELHLVAATKHVVVPFSASGAVAGLVWVVWGVMFGFATLLQTILPGTFGALIYLAVMLFGALVTEILLYQGLVRVGNYAEPPILIHSAFSTVLVMLILGIAYLLLRAMFGSALEWLLTGF